MPRIAWLISVVVTRVVLRCSSKCLLSCGMLASHLRSPLVFSYLLPGNNIPSFCLVIKKERSRESNMDRAMSVKD